MTNFKAPKFNVNNIVRITKYNIIFSKVYTANWSREVFTITFVRKINPWTYQIKYLQGEKIKESVYEEKLLLSKL